MRIGLIDIDGHNFPNLALMKISAYHKSIGNFVEWHSHFNGRYDIVYMSKVFTFTPDYEYYINADVVEKGGVGYSVLINLPDKIDQVQPDYSLYPKFKEAYGYLTRGCIRNCAWCIVPKKEGKIQPYTDIEDILQGRKSAILMDNNILSCDYGISQIEKIIKLGVKVDFNQGLDARLVTPEIANLLSKVKFINNTIRFSCDSHSVFENIVTAKELLQANDFKGTIFVYVLLTNDINECLSRIMLLDHLDWECGFRTYKVKLFAQPYIDFSGKNKVPQWQEDMARWVNFKPLFYADNFENYQPRKGFYCREYLKNIIYDNSN